MNFPRVVPAKIIRRTSYPLSTGLEQSPYRSSIAPCSLLSRTLRAGFAGAYGILDSICARRSADRQVGTKEWSLAVEQRNEVYRLAVTFAV
jgi:hypothetical protein